MTPKEKAWQLIIKFQMKPSGITKELAKRSAIIAVDEIINEYRELISIAEQVQPQLKGILNGSLINWNEVKQEIEKL